MTASSTAKCLEVRAKCVRLKPATRLTLGGKSKSEKSIRNIKKKVQQKLVYVGAMFEKSGPILGKLALNTYSFLLKVGFKKKWHLFCSQLKVWFRKVFIQ